MKKLIVLLLLLPACVCAEGWDKTDKVLYGMVVGFQITDGLTTGSHLKNGNHIMPLWSWKYGTDRPSPLRMWTVKGIELGAGYIVADKIPDGLQWMGVKKETAHGVKKVFLSLVAGTLAFHTMDNMSKGAGFTIAW